MLQIMHRVYLQYLYHYMTLFNSLFFTEITEKNVIYIFKLYTAHMSISRENAVIQRA